MSTVVDKVTKAVVTRLKLMRKSKVEAYKECKRIYLEEKKSKLAD